MSRKSILERSKVEDFERERKRASKNESSSKRGYIYRDIYEGVERYYQHPVCIMASNWSSRSSGQNGLKPRIFTHSSFRPRFLFNETTMRALNPLTVYAVILLKKPIYNCIVRDTILRSGARSSFLTRANRETLPLSSRMPMVHSNALLSMMINKISKME